MICWNCNATLADDAHFCIHCGTSLAPAGITYSNAVYGCDECGGDGSRLPADKVLCGTCRWLRPLSPSYELPVETFLWQLDADAMNVLQSLGPLTAVAHTLSERVGRPWFEGSVNGLRLGEKQLPEIFNKAIKAARILGLTHLPEIYISGDQMWDASTLGTASSAFIVLGSVLINFQEDEILFVLGREMGHVRAGHALWRSVLQFVSGKGHRRSIMGEGVMKALNPAKLMEHAIDAPLMAWARHSEITADTAGLLCVGKEEVARRVLQTWTFRSFPLLKRLNQDAWLEQEEFSSQVDNQIAEWTLASAPYLAGRLKLLREFAGSETMLGWRRIIEHWLPPTPPSGNGAAAPPPPDPNTTRLICPSCKEAMRVPNSVLQGKDSVNIRCPNAKCRAVLTVKPKAPPPPAPPRPDDAGAAEQMTPPS